MHYKATQGTFKRYLKSGSLHWQSPGKLYRKDGILIRIHVVWFFPPSAPCKCNTGSLGNKNYSLVYILYSGLREKKKNFLVTILDFQTLTGYCQGQKENPLSASFSKPKYQFPLPKQNLVRVTQTWDEIKRNKNCAAKRWTVLYQLSSWQGVRPVTKSFYDVLCTPE